MTQILPKEKFTYRMTITMTLENNQGTINDINNEEAKQKVVDMFVEALGIKGIMPERIYNADNEIAFDFTKLMKETQK